MYEFILLFLLSTFVVLLYLGHPVLKHYLNWKKERLELTKRYSRLWRSRRDLLNHFDWAINSGDTTRQIEGIGREIERIDEDL